MTGETQLQSNADFPRVHAGFIPLTDCAPLVVAKELGFDHAHQISLQLHKDVSWANIRDRAEAGLLDCAIMLAPLPLASTLGLGGRPAVAMIAAMATSLNGNAITVSNKLYDDMRADGSADANSGGMAAALSIARAVATRRRQGQEPLTFGMVYPFSSHNYDLRYWLAAAGVDPDNDVNLVVVPPPLIASSLKAGRIDGFCVGEPWNSVAVADGSGVIVAAKSQLWAASPEKVLGMRAAYAADNPETVRRLIGAVSDACAWLDVASNRPLAAEILSRTGYIGIARNILMAALTDQLECGATDSNRTAIKESIIFSKNDANVPWVSHATWLLTQMIRWGQVRQPFDIASLARAVYRPDIFRAATQSRESALPNDSKPEGGGTFFGAGSFDPNDPIGYLQSLAMRDQSVDLTSFDRG